MKIYVFVLALYLYFSFVLAEKNKTADQTLVNGLHLNGLKELNKVIATIAQLEHDGHCHLTGILAHHVATLQQLVSFVKARFVDVKPMLLQTRLVDALAVDMMFVEEQLSNEYAIVQQIISNVDVPEVNLTSHGLIEHAGYVIHRANLSLRLHETSREYSLIEQEVKDVENIVKHLQNSTLNETQLNLQAQVLAQYEMSLKVLEEKAKWRLPCSLECFPSNVFERKASLPLTDPTVVLNMVQLLQNQEEIFKREVNRSVTEMNKLKKEGHYSLARALDYQISQKQRLLANIQSFLAEDNQVFTQHHFQVIIEDSIRLDNRIKQETQIVDEFVRATSYRNETNHQLLSRANLLVKLGQDFINKHENLVEVPEIEFEVNSIQPILGHLTVLDRSQFSRSTEVNNEAERELDRHQKTLLHLMEQAVPK